MNLSVLLIFIPLGIGVAWLFYLIFRANLATQPLGKIISYFLGVVIIILTVGWFMDNLVPTWVNDRLRNAQQSTDWQQVMGTTTDVLDQSLSNGSGSISTIPAPTAVPVINATPVNTGGETPVLADQMDNANGSVIHTVVEGDTLLGLTRQYNVTLDALRAANPGTTDFIYIGDQLTIPQTAGQ